MGLLWNQFLYGYWKWNIPYALHNLQEQKSHWAIIYYDLLNGNLVGGDNLLDVTSTPTMSHHVGSNWWDVAAEDQLDTFVQENKYQSSPLHTLVQLL